MSITAINTSRMSLSEWLEHRKTGIGGSDAGAIMGVNKYVTPLDLYNDKLGLVEKDLTDNQAVYFGNVLEDVVAQEYSRRTGEKVRRRNQIFRHKQHSWMIANIDRDIVGKKKLLECKTTSAYINSEEWGPEGTDQVPFHYFCQVSHYMAVMDYDEADLAVLIGGNQFRIYNIRRDATFEQMLIEKEKAFWENHVLTQIPPEPVSLSDIQALYAKDDGSSISANVEIMTQVAELNLVNEELKRLSDDKQRLETSVKGFMREHSVLIGLDGSPLVTYKTAKGRKSFNAKAFENDHPALYLQYITETEGSRRFLIK